jgi:hypothetical protein
MSKPKYTKKIHQEFLIKVLKSENTCRRCPYKEWVESLGSPEGIPLCRARGYEKAPAGAAYICRSFVGVAGKHQYSCPCYILGPTEAAKRSWLALEKAGAI